MRRFLLLTLLLPTLLMTACYRSGNSAGKALDTKDSVITAAKLLSMQRMADYTLVTVGSRAGWLAEAALESDMEDVRPCQDKEEAKKVLAGLIAPNTAFLFKASRGMALEELCAFVRESCVGK